VRQERANQLATGLTCVRKAGAISKNRQPFASRRRSRRGDLFLWGKLGHRLLWRSHEAAGFALPETDAELVVHMHLGPETDILVDDVDEAFASFLSAGGEALQPPFDIAIGRCARIRDPFGNELVIQDQSKGRLVTDSLGPWISIFSEPSGVDASEKDPTGPHSEGHEKLPAYWSMEDACHAGMSPVEAFKTGNGSYRGAHFRFHWEQE
jgi:hypothetical protein